MIAGTMGMSIAKPKVIVLVLAAGCQPLPAEVVVDGAEASSGAAPTTGPAGTTSPSHDTTAGSVAGTGSSGGASSGRDEGSGTSSEGESSTGTPMDEPLGPFGPPVAVAELNSAVSDDDPTLTGDLLEIYFASNRAGSEDVWRSTRETVDDPWGMPMPVAEVNSFSLETFPEVSLDGLVLLLASDRSGSLDVYYSQRADRDQPWSPPMSLTGLADPLLMDYGATPVPDMSRVLLCRDAAGGLGQSDIWEAPLDLVAWAVGTPVHVPELSTTVADCTATVSASGREIFFETTRSPTVGWSVWTATREDPAGPWDEPVVVTEIDGPFDEIDPWLSPDRRTLWFASGFVGSYDLYVATRE